MVRDMLNAPDIIGVQQADAAVLDALATWIDDDALGAGQPEPGYVAHLGGFLVKAFARHGRDRGSPRRR